MPYNKYAVKLLAGIIHLPVYAKWIIFIILNAFGLFKIAWIYRKAAKGVADTKDLEIFILTAMAKILFQAFCTGFLVSLFGIISDVPEIRMAETIGMSLFILIFTGTELIRKKSLLKRLLRRSVKKHE